MVWPHMLNGSENFSKIFLYRDPLKVMASYMWLHANADFAVMEIG